MAEPEGTFRTVPPHDGRHGRLFPDGDVGNVIAGILAKQQDLLDRGEIRALDISEVDLDQLGAHFTFPVGEPMFLLRASDPRALDAIESLFNEMAGAAVVDDTVTQEHIDAVGETIDRFKAWIEEHQF